jgi:hypothetical protein
MGLRGQKPSKKSLEIIKLLESGLRQFEVQKLGYPLNTIRYYYRKLYKPKAYKRFILKIHSYNRAKLKGLDKTK